MEKKEIFTVIDSMEEQIVQLSTQLSVLKDHLGAALEERNELKVENEHLRSRLDELELEKEPLEETSEKKKAPGSGYDNLAQLYYEGFHICPEYYGSARKDSDCLFCLSFFDR